LTKAREHQERLEREFLAPYATCSSASRGRVRPEAPCPLRTEFQRDRDRIIHSRAFRRLKHKTQVFIAPERDHYRTRLTHTLEAAQIARTISRALRLNEDLTEAIALGHDLGHTPFGHAGESALDEVYREYDPTARFRHNEQSLRVVECLEANGAGLNLTWEVRDGILRHSKGREDLREEANGDEPATPEGRVVRISDRIAYINHDIDDAIAAGIIQAGDLPRAAIRLLGDTHAGRINTMVLDIVTRSEGSPEIRMSDAVREASNELKEFLFENVYGRDYGEPGEWERATRMLQQLFRFYMEHPTEARIETELSVTERARRVCDFIAGMTDRYARDCYLNHFVTKG